MYKNPFKEHIIKPPASSQCCSLTEQQADSNLAGWKYPNGLHKKVIYDTFRRRHLPGYPNKEVDVYINDGREGGYGSISGADSFTEKLWKENHSDTSDVWIKKTPYPNAVAQAAGRPSDNEEANSGSDAYLYVKIKNKGSSTAGSGPVTVKAFFSSQGSNLDWPDGWKPMDPNSVVVNNILSGIEKGVVAGPFHWTPEQNNEGRVLLIVECNNDRAIAEDLLTTDHVPYNDLVPFDNNIGMRKVIQRNG